MGRISLACPEHTLIIFKSLSFSCKYSIIKSLTISFLLYISDSELLYKSFLYFIHRQIYQYYMDADTIRARNLLTLLRKENQSFYHQWGMNKIYLRARMMDKKMLFRIRKIKSMYCICFTYLYYFFNSYLF